MSDLVGKPRDRFSLTQLIYEEDVPFQNFHLLKNKNLKNVMKFFNAERVMRNFAKLFLGSSICSGSI